MYLEQPIATVREIVRNEHASLIGIDITRGTRSDYDCIAIVRSTNGDVHISSTRSTQTGEPVKIPRAVLSIVLAEADLVAAGDREVIDPTPSAPIASIQHVALADVELGAEAVAA